MSSVPLQRRSTISELPNFVKIERMCSPERLKKRIQHDPRTSWEELVALEGQPTACREAPVQPYKDAKQQINNLQGPG